MTRRSAWQGRSVFVTGHTGFKGSWLTIWLRHLGAQVTGYSLPAPTEINNFAASNVRSLLRAHHEADVRDYRQLQRAIEESRPDVIFHLAAQTLVRESYRDPRQTFEVNVMGTVNVLETVRQLNRPCVVIVVTSDKCYENGGEATPHSEADPLGGHDSYSASKGAAEIVTAAYLRSFFPPEELASHSIKVASVRAGNAIGGGDWANDRIIPDTVRALRVQQPVMLRNPRSIRPWQHVLEPLSGYLMLASRMLTSNVAAWCDGWNFGPHASQDATVQELVDTFLHAWGDGRWQDGSEGQQPHEQSALRLSTDKAARELDWQQRWGFSETVRRTADWYRGFYSASSQPALHLCLQDINAYESSLSDGTGSKQLEYSKA